MTAIRLFIGRIRTELGPALMLAVVVLVTAFVAASAPRLFNRAADEGLRHRVAEAESVERNLQLGQIPVVDSLPPPDGGMEEVRLVGERLESALPDSVRRVLADDTFFAESIGWTVPDSSPTRPRFVDIRFQGGLEDDLELVDGRWPTGEIDRVPPSTPPPGHPDFEATVFEIAFSTVTAAEMEVGVGDRVELLPDPDDPLVGQFGFPEPAVIEVVGIYEVRDPDADLWFNDPALERPTMIPVGIDIVLVHSTALASPDAFPALLQYVFPARYTWRHFIDPGRLDAASLEQLVLDLTRMEATYASFQTVPGDATTLQTGLLQLTERFLAERRSAEAILVTAAIGPVAIALAAMAVLAILAISRRRRSLILLRGRGGSVPQIVGSHLVEGLLLAVPPAALGALLATRLVDARPSPWSFPAAGIVAVGTMVVLIAATLPTALSPLRRLERGDAAPTDARPRRLVFEGLAVALAVAGVLLLRQRGLAGGSAAADLAGVDPFLAAVPALVGVAVAIATLRLYPLPVRAAGFLAAGGRGLVPTLGLRRAERQGGTGNLPLIVLLLTIGIGAFSATMVATIERGQASATWQTIGAAHRVTVQQPGATDLDLSTVEGVTAVAPAHEVDATIGIAGGTRVELMAIDAADYEAVTEGTPAETDFPAAFADPVGDQRPGTTELPIPAIVSRSLVDDASVRLAVGSTFELTIASRFATFEVVAIRREMPGLDAGRPFVVVPRHLLSASLLDRALVATTIFVRAPADVGTTIQAAVDELPGESRVESQADVLARLRARPLVQAVERGFAIALAVAVAYAALAIALSLLLAGSARARETAHLRTLGLSRFQIPLLAILEHGPPVLVAVLAGLVLGIGVAWVVLPGLGLGAFTGSPADPALVIDAGGLLAVPAALVVVVGLGIGLSARTQRRADPARAVRDAM